MYITVTREELREILQVNENSLKGIVKRKQLEDKLKVNGYKLINTYKHGRSTVYEVEPIECDIWERLQDKHKIKKKDQHTTYSIARLNALDKTRSSIINDNEIDISLNTAKKYDTILVREKGMEFDKTVYALYNPNDNSFKDITEAEYTLFWKDTNYCRQILNYNQKRYDSGLISKYTLDYQNYIALNQVGRERGLIAIQFDTFKELEYTKQMIRDIQKHISNR